MTKQQFHVQRLLGTKCIHIETIRQFGVIGNTA